MPVRFRQRVRAAVALLMAASLWAILPVVMLFAAIEGRLAEGHTAGAVK